ncbi:hypermethylated in cancer 2 protein-like [Hippocampus comes]|uniref:Hypermethylated in cancer 2 protein-like n=1 Tax=Hippocampus comes TaxID=109280 RepID=A0A3Q2YD97_HIPCM|nr:PREDICTED: hypermethylated in cancer 2 protein-like [Hippocampus comes]
MCVDSTPAINPTPWILAPFSSLCAHRINSFLHYDMEDVGRHAASLLASLNHQREQANLCDCVLRQREDPAHLYPAHKCILAASSPVLASILSTTGSLVDLQAPCLAHSVLELVLDFIYTGVLPPAQSWQQYCDLLAAAHLLEMEQLREVLMNTPPMEGNDANRASREPLRTCESLFPQELDRNVTYTADLSSTNTEKWLRAQEDQKHVLQFTANVDVGSLSSSSLCSGAVPVIRHSGRSATLPSGLQVASWEETHQCRRKHCIDDSQEIPLAKDFYARGYCENQSGRKGEHDRENLEDNCGLAETRTQQQEESKQSRREPLANNGYTEVTHPHLSDNNVLHPEEMSYQGGLHHPTSSSSEQCGDEEETGVSSGFEPVNQTSGLLLLGETLVQETVSVIDHSHTNKDRAGASSHDANGHLAVREQHVRCKEAYTAPTMHNHIQASTSTPSPPRPRRHPFQCSLCTRSFSQRGTLNRHMRTHLGVRPFPCPRCPMTFSRQYRVTEHMRVHQRCSDLPSDFSKSSVSSI